MTLSVIIPVFNEHDDIEECLRALLALDDPVDEIIVVDNNSTDDTRAVVSRMALQHSVIQLTVAREQGVMNARSHGFDLAAGDILARIDADTRVTRQWSRAIRAYFHDHGGQFAAGTGLCVCHDLPFQKGFRRRHAETTRRAARALQTDDVTGATAPRLFGSNMAITRAAWSDVGPSRSRRTDIFEDLDLTLTLQAVGRPVGVIPGADAAISGRRYLSSPRAYLVYCLRDQRTFRVHGLRMDALSALIGMLVIQLPFYLAVWVPFRAYDPDTGRMTLARLRRRSPDRVLPSGGR